MLQTRNAKRPAQAAVRFAVDAEKEGLLTKEDAIRTIDADKGILTSEGGKASHAALVARGMGRPAVTGASELEIDLGQREIRVNGTTLHEGDCIAIDGTSGVVTVDDVPLVDPEVDENFNQILEWADQI